MCSARLPPQAKLLRTQSSTPCRLLLGLLAPQPGAWSEQQGELSKLELTPQLKHELDTTGARDEGEDSLVRTGSE